MSDIDETISQIVAHEHQLRSDLDKLIAQNEQVFKQKDTLEAQLDELQKMKNQVKETLVKNGDFDLHKVGDVKVSVCKIVKLAVSDMNKVPEEFKSVLTVANEKKAQEYTKVFGKPPEGFEDKSYHRFTWRDEGLHG